MYFRIYLGVYRESPEVAKTPSGGRNDYIPKFFEQFWCKVPTNASVICLDPYDTFTPLTSKLRSVRV